MYEFDLDLWYRTTTVHRVELLHEFRFTIHSAIDSVEEWLRLQGELLHFNARLREGFNQAHGIAE
jgi:hypothetical protein